MPQLSEIVTQAGAHPWLVLPVALLLGALHGLEPGHSKTMMAAFVIAVRGTVGQAALLGLSAAVSHTAIVWLVALGGRELLHGTDAQDLEPYFQLASAAIVLAIAVWMLWRVRSERAGAGAHAHHDHDQHHDHHHHHAEERRRIDTGHGVMALEIFEDGVPPRWRLRFDGAPQWASADVGVLTRRHGGAEQRFAFASRGDYFESIEDIPEPHTFSARVSFGHGDHVHAYDLAFAEPEDSHAHPHHHDAPQAEGADAHGRAHARDIARRFEGGRATTAQIVAFGLTGGLIPCPAAVTVLLLCLQLKRFALAVALVASFSVGVAATMVAAGVVAALGLRGARARWPGLDAWAARAPYASGALMIAVALYMTFSGFLALGGVG